MDKIQITQKRLDAVHLIISRESRDTWAGQFWGGVYAHLLRQLNRQVNQRTLH
jgi:hypothetical protein